MSTAAASCEARNVPRAAHSMTTSCFGRSETATSGSMPLTGLRRRLFGRRERRIWPRRFNGFRIISAPDADEVHRQLVLFGQGHQDAAARRAVELFWQGATVEPSPRAKPGYVGL